MKHSVIHCDTSQVCLCLAIEGKVAVEAKDDKIVIGSLLDF